MKKLIIYPAIFIFLIILMTCAKQIPPAGGPVDKQPPQVLRVVPELNATQVPRTTGITVEFSERVERKSVEKAIFISPRQSEKLKFKWRGKKLVIRFPDSLAQNKTYILTIGTEAQDLRHNKLKESFQSAFSTGEHIDNGSITGRVYSQSDVVGTMVGAWAIKQNSTVDPAVQYADYITQCDANGEYRFSYLSSGNYRVFAIQDKDADQKYFRGIEIIGIPTTDVTIVHDSLAIENINVQLAVEDTIRPVLKSVIDVDQNHLDVRFNEPVLVQNKAGNSPGFVILNNEDTNDTLKIMNYFQNSDDGSRYHLITARQIPGNEYLCTVNTVFDPAYNSIDTSLNSYLFKGSQLPDTLKPKLVSQSIAAGEKGVPLDSDIRFQFSEPLIPNVFENHFTLRDSVETEITGAFLWNNPADVSFKPRDLLSGKMKYHVSINVDSVVDQFQNTLADSAIDFYFTTLNKDTLSELSGNIKDLLSNATGEIYLAIKQAGNDNIFYQTTPDCTGTYRFTDILPGTYMISGFRDADSNNVYSYGKSVPFIPAERFFVYPDSIKIRSRWPNEGNDLILNEY